MSKLKLIFFLLSLFLFFNGIQTAHAYTPQRGNVHTVLGPYFFKTNYDGFAAEKGNAGTGVSWIILGDVSDHGSLEITSSIFDKVYFRRDKGLMLSEKAQLVNVSIGYRRWFNETFSGSMSLYTNYPLGNSEKIVNEFPVGQEITTTAQENSETGLNFGLQAELVSSGRYALEFGVKYSWALTKRQDEFSDQYGAMLGIRYFFQGKNTPREP